MAWGLEPTNSPSAPAPADTLWIASQIEHFHAASGLSDLQVKK